MRSRKKGKYGKKQPSFIYVIPGEIEDMTIAVQYSANAWWMDPTKVCKLCRYLERDYPISLACAQAGITMRQYKYFALLHPAIKKLKENSKIKLAIMARKKFAEGVVTDPKLAQKFLEWRDKYKPNEDGDLDYPRVAKDYYIEEYDTTIKVGPGNTSLLFEEVDGKLVEIKTQPKKK